MLLYHAFSIMLDILFNIYRKKMCVTAITCKLRSQIIKLFHLNLALQLLQLSLDQTRSYSLRPPHRNQATTWDLHAGSSTYIFQTRAMLEPSDGSQLKVCTLLTLYSLYLPDRSQVMACIFQTKAELQLVFSRCKPSCSLYTL